MRTLLALSFLLSWPVYSQLNPCFLGFGALTEATEPDQTLIVNTYGDLLEAVGGARLTLPLLEKLASSDDPFRLPAEAHLLDGLQKNLTQLERLLELKGWNVPAVRAGLLNHVAKLKAGRELAQQRQGREVSRTWPDYRIDKALQVNLRPTPHGNIMVGAEGGYNRPAKWTYFDPDTRNLWSVDLPGEFNGSPPMPQFLPGGKEAVVQLNNQFLRLPITNGTPDWAAGKTIAPPPGTNLWGELRFGKSPHYAYFESGPTPTKILRWDLRTNSFVSLPIERVGRGDAIFSWGVIPGSNNLYFTTLAKDDVRLSIYQAERTGKLNKVASGPTWVKKVGDTEQLPKDISWSADGRTGYASNFSNGSRIESFAFGKTVAAPIEATQMPKGVKHGLFQYLELDNRGELGAFFNYIPLSDVGTVEIFDQKTGKAVQSIPVTNSINAIGFSADGRRLYVDTRRQGIQVLNMEKFWESP